MQQFTITYTIRDTESQQTVTLPAPLGMCADLARYNLLDSPAELLIADEAITIEFAYPLTTPYYKNCHSPGGFTRLNLFTLICEGYQYVYDLEEKTQGDPGDINDTLYNRAPTSGPFGIWGHRLEDLCIEHLQYDPTTHELLLFISS